VFDAHCHLNDPRLASTVESEVKRARSLGIRGFVVAGVDPGGWAQQEALQERFSDVVNVFGVHPWVVADSSDEEVDRAMAILRRGFAEGRFKGAAGIGEMGLDWARESKGPGRERQVRIFREQLRLARDLDLPVVLHVVQAHADALGVVRAEGLPAAGGMVHSFHASAELAREWAGLGAHLSVSASVLRGGRRVHEGVRAIPEERILLETDCPDQAPEGEEEGLHGPATLQRVRDAVAALREIEPERLGRVAERNTRRLFRLDTPSGAMG